MPKTSKETIYIEAEDEITAVIDKVVNAKQKIVALVLPKRAAVFQSPVNMKLLKKAAKSANKSLVLITSEKAILAIAAASGIHVAKTLTSKPFIPAPPVISNPEKVQSDVNDGKETVDENKSSDDESINLDNTEENTALAATKPKKKKLIKIPDFSSFRMKMTLGVIAIIVLISLWYVGFVVMPKATVTVNTDTSTTSINTNATFKVGQTELDLENNVLPAERVQVEKIDSVKVPATGEKNIGNKATGKMNLVNCIKSDGVQVVPAGTRFSAGSVTYESTEQAILPEATFNFSGQCRSQENGDDKTVNVIALEPGEKYNVGAQTYNAAISGIRATGSDMTGGSTEIITVISEEDVQKAEQQLKGKSKNDAITEMSGQLEENGKIAVEQTISEGTPNRTVVPAVGEQATEVEVTVTITYSLLGISNEDLSQLLDNEVRKNMGEEEKNIKDNGVDNVVFQLSDRPNEAESIMTIQTVATIGPEINADKLKEEIAGKTRGEIEKQIESIDGVRSVSVEYSPAWVTTTPKNSEKINIIFNEPDEQ